MKVLRVILPLLGLATPGPALAAVTDVTPTANQVVQGGLQSGQVGRCFHLQREDQPAARVLGAGRHCPVPRNPWGFSPRQGAAACSRDG